MKTTIFFSLTIVFMLALVVPETIMGQEGNPIVVDNVINVNRRKPPQASKYYSGTNMKKDKKVKSKIRNIYSWECPSYLHYTSKPMQQRKKMIKKRRNKNTYARLN